MVARIVSKVLPFVLALSCASFAQTVVPHNLTMPKGSELTAKELKDQLISGDLVEVQKDPSDPVHTYTHGPLTYSGNAAVWVTLDGNPADCGLGYCGNTQVRGGENPWWGMTCPQIWGFPNGCFLTNNTVYPLNAGAFTLVSGSCTVPPGGTWQTTDGCTDTSTTAVQLGGYGLGVTYTEVALYQVHKHLYCGHGVCRVAYTNDSVSGTGTTSYTP